MKGGLKDVLLQKEMLRRLGLGRLGRRLVGRRRLVVVSHLLKTRTA